MELLALNAEACERIFLIVLALWDILKNKRKIAPNALFSASVALVPMCVSPAVVIEQLKTVFASLAFLMMAFQKLAKHALQNAQPA